MGGAKKQETNLKRKMKRRMNKLKGKAGFPAQRKKADTALLDSPISVMFVDNTKGGLLAKKFKEEEKRLGRMTGYNVRVAETTGMALSRLLPSNNPWGAGDCGRQDCPMCEQNYEKNAIYCTREAAGWTEDREGKSGKQQRSLCGGVVKIDV